MDFQVISVSGKTYLVHLDFCDEANNIGKEIREILKEKYIRSKILFEKEDEI